MTDEEIVWYVFFGLACLCTVVFYICLYFCMSEESTVDLDQLRRRVKEAKQRQTAVLNRVIQQHSSE